MGKADTNQPPTLQELRSVIAAEIQVSRQIHRDSHLAGDVDMKRYVAGYIDGLRFLRGLLKDG